MCFLQSAYFEAYRLFAFFFLFAIFFRKCVFSRKNLRDLRKMSTFASEGIGVSKHGFSQEPGNGKSGYIICENFDDRNLLTIRRVTVWGGQKPEHLTSKNDDICEISNGKCLQG